MSDITIAVPFVQQTLIGVRQAGYDVQRILKNVGISPPLLHQPRARVSMESFVRLLKQLMRLMDDESLGLLDRPQRLGTFGLIARSTLHETTLDAAMRVYAQAGNLIGSGLIHYVEKRDKRVIFGLRVAEGTHVKSPYILESAIMTAHRFFCWMCRDRIMIDGVDLNYAAPTWEEEYRYLFFGAPVRFNQPEIRVWMREDEMQKPVRQDVHALMDYIARAPLDMFTPLRTPLVSHRTRGLIVDSIQKNCGVPRADEAANALGFGSQTFWRRLRDEGTDYTKIRTQARRDSAIALLGDQSLSVEHIAEKLGFSESSAFIRAFRQWTGLTPMAYRKT